MKVRINGFDIECTPEEFLRLTREMEAGQLVDEFQTLPDDVKIGPYKPNPNFPNYELQRSNHDYSIRKCKKSP